MFESPWSNRYRTIIAAIAVSGFFLNGCETASPDKDASTFQSMNFAGFIGSRSDSGSGRRAAIVDAAFGGIRGAMLGAKLDEGDRIQATAAANAALSIPVGATVEWRSEKNTSIRGHSTSIAESTNSDGEKCRTVRQVLFIDGNFFEETQMFCRIGDAGQWSPGS